MRRFFLPAFTLSVVAGFASVAQAQRHGGLPLSPGVTPSSPFGPGYQFPHYPQGGFSGGVTIPLGRSNAGPGFVGSPFVPNRAGFRYGFGGFGYGYGGYGYGYDGDGYSYGGYGPQYFPQVVLYESPILVPSEAPATLTVQLPAGDNPKEYALTSPVLKPGERYTFAVNIRWTNAGKTYQANRDVTVGPGDRSRLMIVSGDEVKE